MENRFIPFMKQLKKDFLLGEIIEANGLGSGTSLGLLSSIYFWSSGFSKRMALFASTGQRIPLLTLPSCMQVECLSISEKKNLEAFKNIFKVTFLKSS